MPSSYASPRTEMDEWLADPCSQVLLHNAQTQPGISFSNDNADSLSIPCSNVSTGLFTDMYPANLDSLPNYPDDYSNTFSPDADMTIRNADMTITNADMPSHASDSHTQHFHRDARFQTTPTQGSDMDTRQAQHNSKLVDLASLNMLHDIQTRTKQQGEQLEGIQQRMTTLMASNAKLSSELASFRRQVSQLNDTVRTMNVGLSANDARSRER
ncbi:hypothetical protein P7C73_g5161, partial [Tremellales sp. Uapishka_1]